MSFVFLWLTDTPPLGAVGGFISLGETVYVDQIGVHLTPEGNWIIATEVFNRVCDPGALDIFQDDTLSERDDETSQEF
ncbi:MAG: hypothetical protein U9P42_09205 [Candidatus Fermentibacteria bacterium]|nr:hypothetical protein [Candidatus Fermentibacteria bacterium]